VAVTFHNVEISFHLEEKIRLKKWIQQFIESHQKIPGEIAFIFTTNEHLKLMNRDYLNHNYYTDVITFDYTRELVIAGDIFISVEQVAINADTYKTDRMEELRRVMIHGVFHLLGFGDLTEEEQEEMRKMENEALHLWLK
jgi:rRNA maturation RNase YbeY